jgi:ABC-type lipoprotein release transport system permease subunit
MLIRAAANSGIGHAAVVVTEWTETRNEQLRIEDWEPVADMLRRNDQVKLVAPKSTAEGLLGFGTRIVPVSMVGVIPEQEEKYDRLIQRVVEGTYLKPDSRNDVVIGRKIAKRLDVELDDMLMVTVAQENGDMNAAMLRIIGIVDTGSDELDSAICHLHLNDVETLTGRTGAGRLTMIINEPRQAAELAAQLNAQLPGGMTAVTWMELMPELASSVEIDKTWNNLIIGIVTIMVFLGIASAQLTAVLERRREFAVLSALGMTSSRMISIMLLEGLALGILGCVVGWLLGLPAVYWISTYGLDFGKMYGDIEMSMSSVLIEPILFGDMGWWLIPYAIVMSLGATTLSSIYPAWYALHTDPSTALRVEH